MPGVIPDGDVSSSFCVLGVRVDAVQIEDVIVEMETWIGRRDKSRFIAVTGMHGVTEAQHDSEFRQILNSADLVVPDGMPLVWLARLRGHRLRRRVYGPELMLSFFEQTDDKSYRHFFYGGSPAVVELLVQKLRNRFRGFQIAGTCSPPFRPLTFAENEQIISQINRSEPDVLWVGLSTPKQEIWMHAHRHRLHVPILVGVGAAFDINSGTKKQAPRWMREHGFEWLFRLLQEPRRLYRRYLGYGSKFIIYVSLELLGIRRNRL